MLPPSQEVGSARASLNLVGFRCKSKGVFQKNLQSYSRASKTYGHNAFQIIHIHSTPLLSTVVAHTLLNTAHTVGSDCGYNPG